MNKKFDEMSKKEVWEIIKKENIPKNWRISQGTFFTLEDQIKHRAYLLNLIDKMMKAIIVKKHFNSARAKFKDKMND
jgi:hypothetical protein